jgi:hypothetical protein
MIPQKIHLIAIDALGDVMNNRFPTGRRPALWDGKAAQRSVMALRRRANVD